MTRTPHWLRFTLQASLGDWIRLLAKAAILITVVGGIGLFAAIKYTERPSFCRSCHIMEPYYQGWKASSHSKVKCIDCHYAPGLRNSFQGKLQGLSQVAKYFTGTEGTRPWAEIEDASCLRSGCHETGQLTGQVDFNGVKFDHAPHLKDLKRGKKLRCTSCHSQVVQGEHIKVTSASCILCHFKGQEPGKPVSGCLGCHSIPSDTIILPGGAKYAHKNYADRGVDCVSCHASLTVGDGFVPKTRCLVCHNIPVDELLENPDKLHQQHVTDHKIECTDCHEELTHGYESKRRVAQLDCRSCHENMHAATVKLAEGEIGEFLGDSSPHVGPMLAARVECISCHVGKVGSAPEHTGTTRIGKSEACEKCHGGSGPRILERWKQFFDRRIPEVERAIARSRAGKDPLRDARDMLKTVKLGRGVHNPSLGRDLLDAAENLALGKPLKIARPISEGTSEKGLDCSYCHLEVPRKSLSFEGTVFRHAVHTDKLQIKCSKCHEAAPSGFPGETHGKVRIHRNDCASCHHKQDSKCGACHSSGPAKVITWNGLVFSHENHLKKNVSCEKCHSPSPDKPANVSITPQDCASCHHAAGASMKACAKCHNEGPDSAIPFRGASFEHKIHTPLGVECGDCHGTEKTAVTVGDVCSMCHADGIPEASP